MSTRARGRLRLQNKGEGQGGAAQENRHGCSAGRDDAASRKKPDYADKGDSAVVYHGRDAAKTWSWVRAAGLAAWIGRSDKRQRGMGEGRESAGTSSW